VFLDVSKEPSTLIAQSSSILRAGPNRQKHQSGNFNLAKVQLVNIVSEQFRKLKRVGNYVGGGGEVELEQPEESV
jgi:hypothetical protein